MNLLTDSREKRGVLLLLSSARAVRVMACANHSLQSYFFQKEFFGEFIVFRHINMDCTIFFNVILSDLITLSLSFKTNKNHNCDVKKYSHVMDNRKTG